MLDTIRKGSGSTMYGAFMPPYQARRAAMSSLALPQGNRCHLPDSAALESNLRRRWEVGKKKTPLRLLRKSLSY